MAAILTRGTGEGQRPGRDVQFTNEDHAELARLAGVDEITSRFFIRGTVLVSHGRESGSFNVRSVHPAHRVLENTLVTEGRFLDDASYDGLLAAAVELDVPIYIHPHLAPEPVRQAYYAGLPAGAARAIEQGGWGWHSETAIHILRLVLAGALDRHPRLKLIIGHMGEMLPVMLDRIDNAFSLEIEHLQRPVSRAILDQVWLTTSGIFSEPPLLAALLTFGIDRIMFSVDYPYAPNARGRAFLDRISLAPADMAKLTHANADALLRLGARKATR